MILCYVTDRKSLPTESGPSEQALHECIRNAAAAGVDWIQIREKDLPTRQLDHLVRHAIECAQGAGTKILVNDRLDVALAAGAGGIHLGEASLPVAAVSQWKRSRGNTEFTVGVSCHSTEAASAAERDGADYIFFGPVFATPSKAAFGPPQGIERLRAVCAAVRIPVLAIGGITSENAATCIEAGAAGVAAIRLFQDFQNVSETVIRLRKL